MTQALTNARTRQQWADIINADWRKSIDSIIQTGRDLVAAKAELQHGEFEVMVRSDLPFSEGTARKLMRVAEHPAIANRSPATTLPPSWAVLSELTSLSERDFADAQERGLITADTGKREARAVTGAYKAPLGGTVGDPSKPAMLPTPIEARKIAAETGRLVAANNGKIYTGASEEESAEYANKRDIAFEVLRAINALATAPDADEFFRSAERHWFVDFRPGAIDDAREWLADFKEAMGVVDA